MGFLITGIVLGIFTFTFPFNILLLPETASSFITMLGTIISAFFIFLGTSLTIRSAFVSKNLFPERSEWRKTMRDLAIKIESTNIVTVQQQAQIRNNINPYGRGDSKDYLKDGHIHEVLDILKANCRDQDNIEKLVKFLALLLKHDWERSKNENKFIPFTKSSNKWDDKKYETQVKKIEQHEIKKQKRVKMIKFFKIHFTTNKKSPPPK
ncbi:hypothetical protein B5G91_12720 [Listeria monocytogenes]|nr:hypothetical protein [Listeria monocytogenes]